jgi:hypothetical protein
MSDLTKICNDFIKYDNDKFLSGYKNIYKNKFYNFNSFTLFLTTQDKYCIIDNEDGDLLNYIWCDKDGYCLNASQGRMHRVIMKRLHPEISDEFEVDHIDQNRFNNTRANLRYVTHSDNNRNVSAYSNNQIGISGLSHRAEMKCFQCRRSVNGVPYSKSFSYKKIRSYDEAKELSLKWLKEFDNNNPIISIS